jgi:hypothetical protein
LNFSKQIYTHQTEFLKFHAVRTAAVTNRLQATGPRDNGSTGRRTFMGTVIAYKKCAQAWMRVADNGQKAQSTGSDGCQNSKGLKSIMI